MEPENKPKVEAAKPAEPAAPSAPEVEAAAPVNEAAAPAKPAEPAAPKVEAAAPVAPAAPVVDAKAVAEQAIKAERDRVNMVKSVCNGEFPEIEAKAIAEGWDQSQVSDAVLKAYRTKEPKWKRRNSLKTEKDRSTASNTRLLFTMSRNQPTARCPWSRWEPTRQLTCRSRQNSN